MRKPISQRTKRTNEKAYNAWFKFNDEMKNKSMTEPTEEEKQAVIAYFKREGFSLYKVEGLDKLDKEIIEARQKIAKLKTDRLVNQLFKGKVAEIIGLDKTIELFKESQDVFKTK